MQIKFIVYLVPFAILIVSTPGCIITKTKDLTYRDTYKLRSNIIQTDGYYYNNVDSQPNLISAFIFFKNGYLYQGYYRSHDDIKKLFFRNDLKENKYSWGVYRIDNDTIKIQYFTANRGNELQGIWDVIEEQGNIKDINSIEFYKSILLKKEYRFTSEYQFYKMNLKPDSSNWLMQIQTLKVP